MAIRHSVLVPCPAKDNVRSDSDEGLIKCSIRISSCRLECKGRATFHFGHGITEVNERRSDDFKFNTMMTSKDQLNGLENLASAHIGANKHILLHHREKSLYYNELRELVSFKRSVSSEDIHRVH